MAGPSLVDTIDGALRAAGRRERAEQEKRYLKSELVHYGVTMPELRRITRAAWKAQPATRELLLAAVEGLWSVPVHERRAAAVALLGLGVKLLTARDLPLLERLLRESRTWALVDELATHVVGAVVVRIPSLTRELDRWATDDDFWIRRSAMLALLVPLRGGGGDFERFGRYADRMLEEREFFIRKAIGWILRETGRKTPDRVTAWLRPRAARASGLTVREAVKHLPAADRAAILAARAEAASRQGRKQK